ncbi:MAG: CRISPR-associated endonuclease Cas1 [Bacteroidia bacterium]
MNLMIDTPGVYLHVKDEMFEVRKKDLKTGEVQKQAFAPQNVTSMMLSPGVALSVDVVALAVKHQVEIVFVQPDGHPYGRVWQARPGSTTRIRKRQLEASLGPEGLAAVREWLVRKLDNQIGMLTDMKKHRSQLHGYLDEQVGRIVEGRDKIAAVTGGRCDEVAESLRGWEGTAGRCYFEALGVAIPKDWTFAGRSMRPARDPFNAALNYAYGILYSQTERALLIAGLDPYVGFMHRDDYNLKSMVFDFIEPYRIHAERVVFRMFAGKQVRQSHFDAITNGVSLNGEGKAALVELFFAYVRDEKVRHRNRNLSRIHAMQLEAHRFANGLIGKDPDDAPDLVRVSLGGEA